MVDITSIAGDLKYNGQDLVADMNTNFDALNPDLEYNPITYGATITPDQANGLNFKTTITGNFDLGVFSNLILGSNGFIEVTQGGSGGYTMGYDASKFIYTGGVIEIGSSAGYITMLSYWVYDITPSSEIIYLDYAKVFV